MRALLRKSFVIVLCIVLIVSAVPVIAQGVTLLESGGAWSDIKYELYSDGTLILSGEGPTEYVERTGRYAQPWNSSALYITKIIVNEGITELGSYIFRNCNNVVSISLPDSLTYIGEGAFEYTAYYKNSSNWENGALYIDNCLIEAKNIYGKFTVKDGTRIIAAKAFSDSQFTNNKNPYLTSVSIPEGVVSIGACAFSGCKRLASVRLPDSLQYIGNYAFSECSSLQTINLSESLVEIGYSAFEDCTLLDNITLPDSLKVIELNAFSGCSSLSAINLPDGLEELGAYAFSRCSSIRKVEIPSGITELSATFCGCKSLTEIILPDTVESIWYAFYGCSSLNEISLPDSIKNIDSDAFEGTGIFNNPDNREAGILYIGNYLIDADDNIYGRYTIKDGTKLIARSAFADCVNLTGINIPNSVCYIGNYAFYNCTSLSSVTLPESITEISESMFNGCSSLSSFSIGKNVRSIGSWAFSECTALREIIIPDNVECIGSNAFYKCANLGRIELPDKPLLIGDGAFRDTAYYKNSANWGNKKDLYIGKHLIYVDRYTGDYTVRDGTVSVGSDVFSGCNIGTLTISDGVKLIGEDIFCVEGTVVRNIILADSVEYLANNAFFTQYNSFETIKLPSGVTYLPDGLFSWTNLDYLVIPENVTTIGSIFCESGTKKLTIPVSVTEIEENAFRFAYVDEVYYEGDVVQWSNINFNKGNGVLKNAKVHFAGTHSHEYAPEVEKEATCVEDGTMLYSCACKSSYTEVIKATGHEWGGWELLQDSENTEIRECAGCNETETREKIESEDGKLAIRGSDSIKYSTEIVYILPGKNADEIYRNAISGTVICDKHGNEIKSNSSLYSGMVVYVKVGESIVDERMLIIPCDVDGDGEISSSDARLALRNSVDLESFTPWQSAAANVESVEDKKVESDDARYILRASVELEDISEWIKA